MMVQLEASARQPAPRDRLGRLLSESPLREGSSQEDCAPDAVVPF